VEYHFGSITAANRAALKAPSSPTPNGSEERGGGGPM
jgi:hypothetical protein